MLVERLREVDRGLAAELDQRAAGLFRASHMERTVEVERLEVQAVRCVEVGGHCLGVGVDHHRAHTSFAQRPRGVHRAVVELDALPDPDRPGTHDEDGALEVGPLRPLRRHLPMNGEEFRFVFLLPA